jgi:hypothetical protein
MWTRTPNFNTQAFLDSAGLSRRIVEYGRAEAIFSQGDRCESVMYHLFNSSEKRLARALLLLAR